MAIFTEIKLYSLQLDYLSNIDGDSTGECTTTIMETPFSEQFLIHFNWRGVNDKQSLFNNKLCRMTTGILITVTPKTLY